LDWHSVFATRGAGSIHSPPPTEAAISRRYDRSQSPLHLRRILFATVIAVKIHEMDRRVVPLTLFPAPLVKQLGVRQARRDFPSTTLHKGSTSHEHPILFKTTKLSRSTAHTKRATKQTDQKVATLRNLRLVSSSSTFGSTPSNNSKTSTVVKQAIAELHLQLSLQSADNRKAQGSPPPLQKQTNQTRKHRDNSTNARLPLP
jgi:hypothetical protein